MPGSGGRVANSANTAEIRADAETKPPVGYEYGVLYEGAPDEPHRWGMTEEEAHQWVAEWVDMGANAAAMSVIRRVVGQWERAPRSGAYQRRPRR